MTPQEFKAWFEGFSESFGAKLPTKAQWMRIKERIGEIDGKPITERTFVDRWYPYWHYAATTPTWAHYTTCNTFAQNALGGIGQSTLTGNSNILNDGHSVTCNTFDSCIAMNAVGRAEAASLTG